MVVVVMLLLLPLMPDPDRRWLMLYLTPGVITGRQSEGLNRKHEDGGEEEDRQEKHRQTRHYHHVLQKPAMCEK
jgi:hypothetical protein